MWSIYYWLFASIYLYVQPKRRFGHRNQYPDYHWFYTVLKVMPYLVAAHYSPIFYSLVIADSLFDLSYLFSNPEWFKYGLAVWTMHHFSFVITVFESFIFCLISLNLSNIKIEFSLFLYVISFLTHLYLTCEGPFLKIIALLILGTGDAILLESITHNIPYKDQLTMLSSYLYVWLN